ncbi:MAG: hypothetical protein KDD38_01940, partial [Bdellovibrionales bacterium]|nr:hypothetical protein [Bdellovibrionales bacterium]
MGFSVRQVLFFLTLLLIISPLARATPHFDSPMPKAKTDASVAVDAGSATGAGSATDAGDTNADLFEKENLSISKPPPINNKVDEFARRYNK